MLATLLFPCYSDRMEPTHFDLTPEQKGLLATLASETGKPVPLLLDEALHVLQEQERFLHAHGSHDEQPAAPAGKTPRKPFWQKAQEASQRIPEAELERLPSDLAANVDHYISGTPKQ